MAVYLYTPPTFRYRFRMDGSIALNPSIVTCTLVYRSGGVWYNQVMAGMDSPVMSTVDTYTDPTSGTSMLLFFTKPMVVPGALHDALAALTPADSSWTPGTLTLL